MIWIVLGTLLPSFLLSWLSGYVVRRLAPKLGLLDHPGQRKIHAHPIPLGGGVAIWLGVVTPLAGGYAYLLARRWGQQGIKVFAWATSLEVPDFAVPHLPGLLEKAPDLCFLLSLATLLLCLGLADDRWEVSWKIRITVQIIAALSLLLVQGWRLTLFINVPWLTSLATVIWIVWLINSFNMLDNMDGLSAGVAAIAAGMLALVLLSGSVSSGSGPQLFVAGLLLLLSGSLCGFLLHNRPPARLFMGDAGSYFIGFILASATILATFAGDSTPRHAILAPLCVLAVPLYDTATVLWIRIREGRSPFVGDKSHFSHRLVDLGMSKPQAVLTIYLLTATCGLGALLLHQVDTLGASIVLLLVGCVLSVVAILEATSRHR